MIFKNYSESAKLLAQKIQDDYQQYSLTFINSESADYAQKVAEFLHTNLNESLPPKNLIIIDNGSTLAEEYTQFTNEIRKAYPTTNIIVAIPIIPESELAILSQNCDTLLYLHSDPFFFSLDQFYEQHSF